MKQTTDAINNRSAVRYALPTRACFLPVCFFEWRFRLNRVVNISVHPDDVQGKIPSICDWLSAEPLATRARAGGAFGLEPLSSTRSSSRAAEPDAGRAPFTLSVIADDDEDDGLKTLPFVFAGISSAGTTWGGLAGMERSRREESGVGTEATTAPSMRERGSKA